METAQQAVPGFRLRKGNLYLGGVVAFFVAQPIALSDCIYKERSKLDILYNMSYDIYILYNMNRRS